MVGQCLFYISMGMKLWIKYRHEFFQQKKKYRHEFSFLVHASGWYTNYTLLKGLFLSRKLGHKFPLVISYLFISLFSFFLFNIYFIQYSVYFSFLCWFNCMITDSVQATFCLLGFLENSKKSKREEEDELSSFYTLALS